MRKPFAVSIARFESSLPAARRGMRAFVLEKRWGIFVKQVRKEGQLRDGRGFDEF
jgi:hypothetical protein